MDLDLSVRLRLGVSACLTGEPTRYDGGDVQDAVLMQRLAPFADLVPVCPEAGAGLGTPREPIELRRVQTGLAVQGVHSDEDVTARLDSFADDWIDANPLDALDGFVFKSRSPSCGIEMVPVFENGREVDRQPGRFAASIANNAAFLPTCNELQLGEPRERRHFLERAVARARWRLFVASLADCPAAGLSEDEALAKHLQAYDLSLIARGHQPIQFTGDACDPAALRAARHVLAAQLDTPASVAGQIEALAAVLEHIDVLPAERDALTILIEEVQIGRVDVEVARQLARGLCARGGDAWLRRQHFFDPFPAVWRSPTAAAVPFLPA